MNFLIPLPVIPYQYDNTLPWSIQVDGTKGETTMSELGHPLRILFNNLVQ